MNHLLRSDFSVTVKKFEILDNLRRIQKEHAEEYELAFEGYVDRFKEAATAVSLRVNQPTVDEKEDLHYKELSSLLRPSNHADLFETLIPMLESAEEDVFELSAEQYQTWVQGKFPEIRNFKYSNEAYITSATLKRKNR